MSTISIDIDIEEVLWGMSTRDKQELVDDLYDEGYVPKKIEKLVDGEDDDWNIAIRKLIDNKWRLTNEEEEIILRITNKLV